jgi:hypothetical protein
MLREDIPGGRLLTLRRRRSRLPWIYSVYHVTRSNPDVEEGGHVRPTGTEDHLDSARLRRVGTEAPRAANDS